VRIGLVVNPIAGMGGSVGLKGTDGDAYLEALRRGAKPVSPSIAKRFVDALKKFCRPKALRELEVIACPGIMGCDYVSSLADSARIRCLDIEIGSPTTAEDTKRCVDTMLRMGVDLVVFVGGDGTARDVASVIDQAVPMLGIPSGVKMYSGVFAVSPEAGARIVCAFIEGLAQVVDGEVEDLDEDAFRRDELRVKMYYSVKTVALGELVAPSKDVVVGDEEAKRGIAKFFVEELYEEDALYLLGPGTTVKAIADELGVEKTLLGFDAVYGRRVLGKDLWGKHIVDIVSRFSKRRLVLTPIGGQGFLIGRGNKQLIPEALRLFSKSDLIVVATPRKLAKLRYLIIDTGDEELDKRFSGYHRVITGYREFTVVKIVPAREVA